MSDKIDLQVFDTAIVLLKGSRNKLRDVVIHATKLHMVYGVPVQDTVKHTGRANNDEIVNRNSVYALKDKVLRAIEFSKSVQ